MSQFIVSARKYRPQTFDTVIGQGHITTTLKNAIRTRQLAHAFLFCGPRGVGKTTCARILAKTINCENLQPDGEACDKCTSCRTFNEGTSLNIHELDAASNNSVDDIRALVEQVRFAPQAGKYKVYIVDEVHMLSSSAFNAFLKTLEEPPSYAIFILATTEKHKILPTILSRCQTFDFKRITIRDTVEHLEDICQREDITAEKAALQVIAQKSEGCMRDALSIMDKIVSFTSGHLEYANTLEHLNILDDDYYFRLLDYMLAQDLSGALLLYDDINRKGFEGDLVLGGMAEFLRNLLVCRDEKVLNLLDVVETFRDKYKAASAKVDSGLCISALNVLNEAELTYKGARNKRLHVELTLIKLTYLAQALELVQEGPEGLSKKKLSEAPLGFRTQPIVAARVSGAPAKTGGAPAVGAVAGGASAGGPATGSARLTVETPGTAAAPSSATAATAPPAAKTPPVTATRPAAGPSSAVPPTTAAPAPSPGPRPEPSESGGKLNSLHKLRQQIASQQKNASESHPLTLPFLTEAWQKYIILLQERKNHSAVTNFKLAELRIVDEQTFEIITGANIQQKFIEQERALLIEHIQTFFNNRKLTFQVLVEETEAPPVPTERPLNTKELFQQMSHQYPLVKELKDRLKLDLDY
ncbi:DNA polymerase III subunit gamma/tau [Dinghuibacter silviterrae]|uniref:DNA polymerase III subunit gamma/tau n=1 Tax=Dinghuibacter silviterrae TaxID=1539049 RepID=A0A4R8DSV2_9BACT|nr:DNA polymerase III subunit gamma/tau [Dinghuibacter silviterrae]TDX00231.1 DNA polymerase-3 subunit gamma/tau [Dinghuibacter silviterrae]